MKVSFLSTLLYSILSFTVVQDVKSDLLDGLIPAIRKSRCLVPSGVSQISRALLLQQCFDENEVSGNETACYDELGCFPMSDPWVSLLRPLPSPNSPARIDVHLTLFTRSSPEGYNVTLWPQILLEGSDLKSSRPKTVFIIHGFASNGRAGWLHEMKNAYLKMVDANVFVVDWGKGASDLNYLQVASNTRIVGAELARFGKFLTSEAGINASSLHLIGHSLGSHIASYMADGLKIIAKAGRITALDPAQPGFEGLDPKVRISTDDADFVDVIHTDAKPFIPFIGFGMMGPVGHVDFYVNGGSGQPGCLSIKPDDFTKIKSINDLAKVKVEVISKLVSCSHGRAYEIFTSTILAGDDCTLWGRKMPLIEKVLKVGSLGKLALADPLVDRIDKCDADTCSAVGLSAPIFKARGYFAASTNPKPPFCESDTDKSRSLKNLMTGGLYGALHGIKAKLSPILKDPKSLVRSSLKSLGL